jgi:hypothetical protein
MSSTVANGGRSIRFFKSRPVVSIVSKPDTSEGNQAFIRTRVSKPDTLEGNQAFVRNRVSKPDTLEGNQAFIRTKGRRKSSN